MYSTFCPPSLEWFKHKVSELHRVIGTKRINHWQATNLLARMYGYGGWSELRELRLEDPTFPTEWDAQLDDFHLTERWERFVDELNAELGIEDPESVAILQEANVTRPAFGDSFGSHDDDFEDVADKLQTFLREMAPHTEPPKNIRDLRGSVRTLRTSR